MTPPNELTRGGGRDDRAGVPYHAESTLSSAQVLKREEQGDYERGVVEICKWNCEQFNMHKKQCHYDSHFESFLVPCRFLWRLISDHIGSEQATRGSRHRLLLRQALTLLLLLDLPVDPIPHEYIDKGPH